jgi:hypothetical protein
VSKIDRTSSAATSRWKGWRTEFVGLRAFLWLLLAGALECFERLLHRFVARATRRYTVRAHEYDVRCRNLVNDDGASNVGGSSGTSNESGPELDAAWTRERRAMFADDVAPIIEDCGVAAADESMLYQFRRAVIECEDNFGVEFRFCGKLGFGGKFHMHPTSFAFPNVLAGDYRAYVSCYPEDRTPERDELIEAANERLTKLNDKYAEDIYARA